MRSLSQGPSPAVPVKMPEDLLEELDRQRAWHGNVSRSAFIRYALREALGYYDKPEESDAE